MRNELQFKTVISFVISIVLMLVLIDITGGIFIGMLVGGKLGRDKVFMEEISNILESKGIVEPNIPNSNLDEWYRNLPPEIHKEIENAIKLKLQDINWFVATLGVSVLIFGIVGFLYGFINKAFITVGLIIILSFFMNNPVVRFPFAKSLDFFQRIVIIVTQFGICYLFGYFGASLGRKLSKKHFW